MKMTMVRASILGALVSTAAVAAEPKKVWETGGLKNPESAVHDPVSDAVYVSNVNGGPVDKDGNGFVSKLGSDGRVVALEWVEGLDAPKGLALVGGRLYAADLDQLVEIDVAKGEVAARHAVPGAKMLNDVTADASGRIYVSDMVGNSVWMLDSGDGGGAPTLLVHDDALDHPNGLLAEDGRLVVASWGTMDQAAAVKVPGRMRVVDLGTGKVSDLGDPATALAGNLDGIVPDGKGGHLVTDWVNGGLFHLPADGKPARLLPLKQGSADLGVGPGEGVVMIPMMKDGTVVAYRVD